jgi:16S rRNA (uracil1498-N3)-methyltransferase
MNLILFEAEELDRPLSRTDARAVHILTVLRLKVGDEFEVGWVDGPRGCARLEQVGPEGLVLSHRWGEEEPPLAPLHLIVGLSRPPTCRKILREASAMGVAEMCFVRTELGEASYAQSKLWSTDEAAQRVREGLSQACSTRLPRVEAGMGLGQALGRVDSLPNKLALDNVEATVPLATVPLATAPTGAAVVLAVGGERGWTARERALLRGAGFTMAGIGSRVLRVETAVVSGLAVVKARMGAWG